MTTVSAALARRFADVFGLDLFEPPLKQKTLPLTTVVAATRAHDPGVIWLGRCCARPRAKSMASRRSHVMRPRAFSSRHAVATHFIKRRLREI